MNKKYALILSLLITGLIANTIYLFSLLNEANLESAVVERVIDGDTIVLQDGRQLRLANINSPEKSSSLYPSSLREIKKLENQTIQIEILGLDKYQRYLGRIYSPNYLNLELVYTGMASKFLVDEKVLKEFSKAEKQAIENQEGIWNHSIYYGCFSSEIDKNEEFLVITNNCQTINLKNWILKDESRKTFVFPEIEAGEITIHSEEGENTKEELFWNSKTNIWNNDRDSLYLFDEEGKIAHYDSYGY